ncbi:MAG: hypothetical protein IPJ69_01700 [Deltaproteobacteria bacterium]|nr:MAG: hypothetical protein IPJ69_01700 [Deltaproteobacteria bacterium]
MKKNSVFESTHCTWVDIENPTESDLEALSKEYQIPFHALKDCLQADHLPKYEELDGIHFLILRLMDDQAADMAKSIQGLTRKVAIFQKTDFVLTIHRSEMKIWTDFKEKKRKNAQSPSTDWLVSQMMKCVFHSFEPFLFKIEDKLSTVSAKVFSSHTTPLNLEKFHQVIRKVSLIRRILRMQVDVIFNFEPFVSESETYLKDAHEEGDRVYFFADDLYEAMHLTLQTYFSQSSHRTNEIMRVLTIFSALFLPITFLAGVYGMNFDYMPELRKPWAYPLCLLSMGLVSVGIFIWARKKGWFQKQ